MNGRGGRSAIEELVVSVSIDTECDHDPSWRRSDPLAFESIVEGLPNRLQPAFAEVGAVPTYLLTVEVMENDAAVRSLRALEGAHELGTHLHAAFVRPARKHERYAGIDSPDFQCGLPPALEREKLATLTALFRERFGHAPKSFRAGRFGAGAATIDSLEALGYAVDTSVTPYKLWREHPPRGRAARWRARATELLPRGASRRARAGLVDFRDAPEQPYFPAPGTIARRGPARSGRLLEVPISVRPARWLPRWREPTWFRPWFADVEAMKAVVRHQMRRHADRRILSINMMFHSMEVIERASPYPQSADEVRRFLDDMRGALRWCAEEGARFVPLGSLADVYARDGGI